MSSDFSSLVTCLEASSARKLAQLLESAESVQPIVDADGVTFHDFATQGDLSLRACAMHMEREGPPPEDLGFATFVGGMPDVDFDASYFSSSFPLVTVLDRVIAIPHGVSFLRGRAFRRFRPKAVERCGAAWSRLVTRVGGTHVLARRLVPYVDRGGESNEQAIGLVRAIGEGFERARDEGLDLVIAGCLASEIIG